MLNTTSTGARGVPASRPSRAIEAATGVGEDDPRRVVIDLLATAVTDLLLEEVEREAARRGEDEPTTR